MVGVFNDIAKLAIAVVLAAALMAVLGSCTKEVGIGVTPSLQLFNGESQYQNFAQMDTLFPGAVRRLTASTQPQPFPAGRSLVLPATYSYQGQARQTEQLLKATDTSALLVLQAGRIRFENYWLTGGQQVPWLSMSVAKSFISALVGVAVAEGHIHSIDDAVTQYLPQLVGSSFDGVAIKHILQMSSGSSWNEDYSDPQSDIARLGAATFAPNGSLNEFIATLKPQRPPGTFNRYNSAETQVLTQLLVQVTKRPVTSYMQEKLWTPLGAESAAYWLTDSQGIEMGYGGLNATARDYAKIGELYRLQGAWQGQQLVPAAWVAASVRADAPHLVPGSQASDFEWGYGYQWWLMDGKGQEFAAVGVYNQFIYVLPQQQLVVVKLSANPTYGSGKAEDDRELETIEFFRAIAASL